MRRWSNRERERLPSSHPHLLRLRYHVPEANDGETWGPQDPPGAKEINHGVSSGPGETFSYSDFLKMMLGKRSAILKMWESVPASPTLICFLFPLPLSPGSPSTHSPECISLLSFERPFPGLFLSMILVPTAHRTLTPCPFLLLLPPSPTLILFWTFTAH